MSRDDVKRLVHRCERDSDFRDGVLLADHSLANLGQINASAIVAHNDHQHPGAVPRFESQQALQRLARLLPLLRRFEAVIEGISQ